ncbi:MAG: amidohydrolase [Pseudomonadales bacterium]|nr:amidohydrolase [Pseudomonadales bacterium]
MQPLTVALIQAATHWHDPGANRRMFEPLIHESASQADLIVLPEMFSTGFTMASAEVAEDMSGPTLSWLKATSKNVGSYLCGSVVIRDEGDYFNRFVWVSPGGEVGQYDKRHLFRMAGEHEHYALGEPKSVFKIGDWRVCAMVCYDLRFPVWFRNEGDYDAIVAVANWPAARRDAWLTLLKARAIENQVYAAGVNIVGVDGNDVAYAGGSAVYGPDGEVVVERLDTAGIEFATFDAERLSARRDEFPVWRDADKFSIE